MRDHPRLRGEHLCSRIYSKEKRGSPPPTRGTLTWVAPIINPKRITPAYAGNTMSCPLQGIRFLDHPRLRGEHSVEKLKSSFDVGSPPPTRGTLKAWYKSSLTSGITPAYAGNTSPCPLYILKLWDHPRLRGEHSAYHHWPSFEIGSPPPTRGTLKSSRHRSISSGITPAYAGNTGAKKAEALLK